MSGAAVIALAAFAPAAAAVIEGEITFPGGNVPPLIAYAYEIDAARLRALPIAEDQSKFALHVPPGRYFVFLAPNEPGAPNIYGAYTDHSACAARAAGAESASSESPETSGTCGDHRLATVRLNARERRVEVKIDDWYLSDATAAELDRIRGQSAAPITGPIGAPRFSEYAVAVTEGAAIPTAAMTGFASNAEERRTIRQSLAKGPNFAGHITIVRTRCGSGCERLLLLDWRTDKISEPPALAAIRETLQCRSADAVQFRRDSRLLSVTRVQDGALLTDYYLYRPDAASLALLAQYRRKAPRFCAVDPE